jgi:Tol biopolymer transport system component
MTPPVAHRSPVSRTAARLAGLPLVGLLLTGCDSGSTEPEPPAPEPIAFVAWDGPASTERVYLVDADGTKLRALPLGRLNRGLAGVAWAPDRRRLALAGAGVLYVLDTASTSLPSPLPLGAGLDAAAGEIVSDAMPAWSPDGTRLAFTRRRTEYRTENASDPAPREWTTQICVARADGSGVTCLAGLPGRAGSPAWSPDGRRLAFAAGDASVPTARSRLDCPTVLYVADADGANARAVTALPAEIRCGTLYVGDTGPAWSPDGRHLAFVSDRQRGSYQFGFGHIHVVGADGSGFRRLTQTPSGLATANDRLPSWSPDGTRIAYAHEAHTTSGSIDPAPGLHVMNADGSGSARIVSDVTSLTGVAWRPRP